MYNNNKLSVGNIQVLDSNIKGQRTQLMKEMMDLRMEPWDTNMQLQRPESKKFIEVLQQCTTGNSSKNESRAQTSQKKKRR